MALTVAVVNQKGGVGKTTTAVNVSAALAEAGERVLIVDADPQGNASSGVGFPSESLNSGLYDVLCGRKVANDAICRTSLACLDLLPSSVDLVGIEIELADSMTKTELKESLLPVYSMYDYICLDTPPSLGILTLVCLVSADRLLIPIQCEYYALEGLRLLMRTIELVKRELNPNLEILGLVRTMFDGRTNLANQVASEVQTFFPNEVFNTIIPRSVRLSEAPSYGEPIISYDPRSAGAEAYRCLAREIMERTGVPSTKPVSINDNSGAHDVLSTQFACNHESSQILDNPSVNFEVPNASLTNDKTLQENRSKT